MAITGTPSRFRCGSSASISAVSPELDSASTHIAARHHAQVAMAGLGRMQEEGRRAGAGQRGGDLAADMAGLAQAGDHHAAACAQGTAGRRARSARRAACRSAATARDSISRARRPRGDQRRMSAVLWFRLMRAGS